MTAQKSGDSDEAIELFRGVAKLKPGSAEAHLNLGIALADRYRLEEALSEFSTAEQLTPNSAAPHYNRGRVLADLRRYEEALPELKEACRVHRNFRRLSIYWRSQSPNWVNVRKR